MSRAITNRVIVWLPYIWLLIFFLAPFVLVGKISLSEPAIAQPPYRPTFDWADGVAGWWGALKAFSIANYTFLTEDALYWKSY
ncbi:MAG: ABC transporter permease, partial [Pseudomonadota bacterium]